MEGQMDNSDLCGVMSASGAEGEMLACAFPPGHEGWHSWGTLPTFIKGATLTEIKMQKKIDMLEGVIIAVQKAKPFLTTIYSCENHLRYASELVTIADAMAHYEAAIRELDKHIPAK
jgi:hypothetical protein